MNKIGFMHIFAVVGGALLIVLLSSAYIVNQAEQAIVFQFGQPISARTGT